MPEPIRMYQSSGRLIITVSGVWTGVPGQQMLTPGAVVVHQGRIEQVGPPSEVINRTERPYERVNLDDSYLLPGLINAHVHLTFSGSENPLRDYTREDEATLMLRAVANARTLLASGVTSVRDCGCRGYGLIALKTCAFKERIPLPRVVVSGPPLTPTGGHLHWMSGEADGVERIREGIRQRVKMRVDSLKLIATGGVMTSGTRPEVMAYTDRELRSAAAEAHHSGLTTAAHCLCAPGIAACVRARICSIEHCVFYVRLPDGRLARRFNSEVAKEVADIGTYVTPTLSTAYHLLDETREQEDRYRSAEHRFKLEQERLMLEHFACLANLGVPMLVGTDAGVTLTPFNETYLELKRMVEGGFTSAQALQAATYNAAEALGIRDKVGTIEPGKDADLVVCRGSPLEDVRCLKEVVLVMREGRIVAFPTIEPKPKYMDFENPEGGSYE